jgi:tetratricopeptide (TPR) repeat protein
MAQKTTRIDKLFKRGSWKDARRLLLRKLEDDPESHWLLTQLGVTFYEQRKYEKALKLFLASRKIVGDCPLTLWNLAGTLGALGKHAAAIRIYTGLLESKVTADDDPCWESKEWSDALKADCVYSLGVCFQRLGKKRKAEQCFRQYLDLLLTGIEGIYSVEDTARHIRELHGVSKNGSESKVWKEVHAKLRASGVEK